MDHNKFVNANISTVGDERAHEREIGAREHQMNHARFGLASLAAATLIIGLAACGAKEGTDSAQENQMYTWVSSESDREQWETFVKGVKEKEPDFNLTLEGPSFQDYWTKAKTRLSSADAPCILTTQAARAQELQDILTPLDELAKGAHLDLGQYNAAMMTGMTVNGAVRAIPYDAEPMVLFYNKSMFKEAGLREPGLDYTKEQFLADAKALTKDGVNGFAVAPDISYPLLPFVFADGRTPLKEDGSLALTDPSFVESAQWVFDLVHKHKVATAPNPADTTDVPMQQFQAGKAAMVIEGPWFYSTIREGMESEVGVAVIPSDKGKPVGMIQGSGFGITEKCPAKEKAFANIAKMTTPEVVAYVGKHRGTVPSIETSLSGWGDGKPAADVEVIKALLADGKPLVTPKSWNQVVTQFTQYASDGYRGKRDAADILAAVQQSVE